MVEAAEMAEVGTRRGKLHGRRHRRSSIETNDRDWHRVFLETAFWRCALKPVHLESGRLVKYILLKLQYRKPTGSALNPLNRERV